MKGTLLLAVLGVPALLVRCSRSRRATRRLLPSGMPPAGWWYPAWTIGSPIMEMPDGRVQPCTVERIDADEYHHAVCKPWGVVAGGGAAGAPNIARKPKETRHDPSHRRAP